MLYNESPAGIDAEVIGLNKQDLATLQNVAWRSVSTKREVLPVPQ
jgi:hypothetical protein